MSQECVDVAELTNLMHLELIRWGGTPVCPYCSSPRNTPHVAQKRYHCNTCNTSFSVTVGTPFHNTKIDLGKWYRAVYLIVEADREITGRELARRLGVNRNTGCRMTLKIQTAMHQKDHRLLLLKIAQRVLEVQGENAYEL